MSIEKVRAYFAQFDMEQYVQEFSVSSATVELAAAALNCEPKRIAKTLSFLVLTTRSKSGQKKNWKVDASRQRISA